MDIKKLSGIELKSLAFDALVIIEQNQNNLKIIDAELKHRQNNPMNEETLDTTPAVITDPVETPATEPIVTTDSETEAPAETTGGEKDLSDSHVIA